MSTGKFISQREGATPQGMGKDGTGGQQPVEDPVIGKDVAVVLLFTALVNIRPGVLVAVVVVAVEVHVQLAEGTVVIAVEAVARLHFLRLFVDAHQPVVKLTVGINIAFGFTHISVLSGKSGEGVLHSCLLFG